MTKLLNLFRWRRRRLEQALDRELRYHLDRRVEDLITSGLSESEARRQACIEIGGVAQVQDDVKDTWAWRWLDNVGRDIRYSGRMLVRSPGFTVTAVVSLALGIGVNAGIFSLFDQVLLRPLPGVTTPERLVLLEWKGSGLQSSWGLSPMVSYPLCRDLQAQDRFFDGVFCRHPTNVNLSTGREHDPVRAEIVSGSYFPVLGVQPTRGRLINRSDDRRPGAHPVVVLSYHYWKNSLGGVEDVVGRKVLVNSYPMTVIGIAPASFHGVDVGHAPALFVPAMMTEQVGLLEPDWDRLFDRRTFWMHVFGRLKPGVTAARAKVGLQPWFKSMLEADTRQEGFPSVTAEQRRAFLASTIDLRPAARGLSGLHSSLERPLWLLMGGTGLLLLLASLNVASLLLARAAARSRELTTRMALGASRGRITGQLLVESLLITLGGGLLGLVTAPAVSRVLLSLLSRDDAALSARVDHRIFLFAFLVSVVTAGVCGLASALQTGRVPLMASFKERSQIATIGGVRLRKALVAGQMAFTLILLVGAGLFVQTLASLYAKGPGYVTSRLLMFKADPRSIGYPASHAEQAMRDLLRELQDRPGVERAALANAPMLTGASATSVLTIQFNGRIVTDDDEAYMRVGPGFFSTLGIPVIAGRNFDERDVRGPHSDETSYRSIIVNESFARRYFGDESPLGHRVGFGGGPETSTDIEIVGVVQDFSRRSVRDEDVEVAYVPFWEGDTGDGTFYVKFKGNPESAFASIRAAVERVDPRLPILDLTTLDDQIDESLTTERMLATLSSGFGAIALLLSVVGLYGVMSFVVTRRTQEIGVRMALGGTRSAAVWLIVRDAVIMIAAGTAVALPCIWALGRLVEAQLFGVRAVDGSTIAAASGILALITLGTAMLPAWHAASISPTEALRLE